MTIFSNGFCVKNKPQYIMTFTLYKKQKKLSIEHKIAFCSNSNNKKDIP